jgi:hypothetical protein
MERANGFERRISDASWDQELLGNVILCLPLCFSLFAMSASSHMNGRSGGF